MVKTPHWPIPLGYKPIDFGLDRIKLLLERLRVTEKDLPPVIHVAGTNGKGSTIAFLRKILETAGYKVHCYTSPNLIEFNERIVVAGKQISDDSLYKLLEECRKASHDMKITFFEGTTAAALLAFSRTKADVILMETGLGGRLDATNIFAHPLLTIITPISFDHMEFLGDSIAKIAAEKAAIIKQNVPCIVSQQLSDAAKIIETEATKKHAPLLRHGQEWDIKLTNDHIEYSSASATLTAPLPSLQGAHQIINAGTAITAALCLTDFSISHEDIANALTTTTWPGRLQKLEKGKLISQLPPNFELWVEGAHNEDGARVMNDWIDKQDKPVYLVFGMLKNKDTTKFFTQLKSKNIRECYAVAIPDEKNSLPESELAHTAANHGLRTTAVPGLKAALDILTVKTHENAIIIICGSLYLVGAALAQNN